jgi:inorganic triphosphatase YgiF
MATELEIKLTLSEASQAHALGWFLSLPEAHQGPTKTLLNRYFDTPDSVLNRARAALRVRKAGDRYIQTLKTRGEFVDGAHQRQEWEWPIPSAELDLSLLHETPLADQLDLAELRPVFETNFQRQVILLDKGSDLVEVAVDTGTVTSGDAHRPLHEVELELKHGDGAVLLGYARRLAEQVPVFLNLVSKAEQGYFLAGLYQPDVSAPAPNASPVMLLSWLSRGWLTGAPLAWAGPGAGVMDEAAACAGLESAWREVRHRLAGGATVNELIEQVPAFGQLQLAVAAG